MTATVESDAERFDRFVSVAIRLAVAADIDLDNDVVLRLAAELAQRYGTTTTTTTPEEPDA